MRVESVGWAAERKDVLSIFFCAATLLVYVERAQRKKPLLRAAVAGLFACALLSKTTVAALPLGLLAFDVWPLGRARSGLPSLLREKAELFALSAAASAVAPFAASHILIPLHGSPLSGRLANACVSLASYLGKTAWPAGLSFFYRWPEQGLKPALVLGSILLLAVLSAAVLRLRRRAPYLAFGGTWFILTLLPMLQLVQIAGHAMANRYAYLPHVGLAVAAAWGAAELLARAKQAHLGPWLAAAAVLLLAIRSRAELPYWSSKQALFERACEVDGGGWWVHAEAARLYAGQGRHKEALRHLEEAVRLRPREPVTLVDLGYEDFILGDKDGARRRFEQALGIAPDNADLRNNLGVVLASAGRKDEAAEQFSRALSLRPGFKEARANLDALAK
jgi:tetratricopeptide (TPR) repeat protein